MKHIFAILTLALISLAAHAEASVKWLETHHNFGAFDEDFGPATTVFKFVNTGDVPVSILAANASCGCTSPKYSRKPVAPGDTASISVTYDPAGRPGRFTKYIGVELSGDVPKAKLFVSGTVVGNERSIEGRFPVRADNNMSLARGAAMFGPVFKGAMRTYNLQAYNRSTDSIRPSISNLPDYIKVDVTPQVVPPGEQLTFILYFSTYRCPLYGLVEDSLYVSSDPASDKLYILPVTAMVEEDFTKLTPRQLDKAPIATLDNSRIDFGRVSDGERLTGSVKLRNTGRDELKIRRVYSSDPGVTVTVDKKKLKHGKEAVITATVDTGAVPGKMLNARVALITNDPANPTQIIRLVGEK